MYFLYCVWAYNKNYKRIYESDDKRDQISDESDDDSTNEDGEYVPKDIVGRYETFDYNFLIKQILNHSPDSATEKIIIIADQWRLMSNENIVMSMLINRQDVIVNAYEAIYREYQTTELFIHAIQNQNELYLQDALEKGTYGSGEFEDESVIAAIQEQLDQKNKTEFILNILIYADFSSWKGDLEALVGYIGEITEEAYEENRIVLSYNPILTICLACQHLASIGDAVTKLLHECEGTSEALLDLGA